MIYMSPDPYHEAFEEVIDIRRFDFNCHCTAGLCLAHTDGRLILGGYGTEYTCRQGSPLAITFKGRMAYQDW